MRTYRNAIIYAGFTAAILASQAAYAQETAVAPEQPENGEIIVTAQKRSQSVQRVPAAVAVASGEQLETLGIRNVSQLTAISPSVRFSTRGQQTLVYLRGVGQAVTQPNADPAVATNVNGVYIPAEMTGSAMFDTERVEIVTGPQGTLYGRNAVGGVINVVTKQPGNERTAEGYLEYGNYDAVQAFAAVNLPVSDAFAVRVAGLISRRDGFFNGDGDDQDQSALRVTARWDLSSLTRITVAGTYARNRGTGGQSQNNPRPFNDIRRLTISPRDLGYFVDYDTYLTSAELQHELSDNLTFTYLAGYNHFKGAQFTDVYPGDPNAGIPTFSVLIPQKTELTTQEARINGKFGSVDFVTGVYYYDSTIDFVAQSFIGPVFRDNVFDQKAKGYAGFAQATVEVLPGARLTGGIRYSSDKKSIVGRNMVFRSGVQLVDLPFAGRLKTDRVDWRAGAELDVTSSSLLYGSVATGFNQAGFSSAPTTIISGAAATYLPAELVAYTAGMKNRFFDNMVTLNLEVFRYDYKNYQVASRNLATAESQIYNAESVRIKGLQVDASVKVGEKGQLSGSVVLLDGDIRKLLTPAGSFAGRRLPFSPERAFNVNYRHEFDIGSDKVIRATANFSHSSSQYAVFTNANGSLLKANNKLNANLDYGPQDGSWSIGIWGRNITDTETFETLNVGALPGPGSGFVDPPRTYGVRVSANF
ncbi:Pesticin receptor (plasmid) [Sphingobium sp. AntQ-1]|uniref:TonB-dependent receptor n=1 Tax=Sphingobium sp. AntQ-1 TaxID=2930091 RepID=UPI00234F49E1|nr:TonB-dependent receptor [Sphingobium sp. AntQ-1]WCP15965.1 Pesticin receptor [Sphingobium sp. AntQ-1]